MQLLALSVLTLVLFALFFSVSCVSAAADLRPFEQASCRLVCVADLHGDLDQAKRVLGAAVANVVDDSGNWNAGCTTLVQTGDLVDRGPESLQLIDYFSVLQRQARLAGGQVVLLLSNHEVMNMAGQHHYVHDDELAAKGGEEAWRNLFAAHGKYGKILRRRRKLVHQDPMTKVVFVHAGITPEFAKMGGVDGINNIGFRLMQLNDFHSTVFSNNGVVWDRTLIGAASQGECATLEESLALLGNATRMVVGHTPQSGGKVGSYCGAKLIAADVGISKHMAGGLAAVEIDRKTGKAFALYPASASDDSSKTVVREELV